MSATTSPATGRVYGLERVCSTWGVPRSSFYARRATANDDAKPVPGKRGPRPKISDEDLLAAIKADLATSPFIGEGHRKVNVIKLVDSHVFGDDGQGLSIAHLTARDCGAGVHVLPEFGLSQPSTSKHHLKKERLAC